MCRQVKDAEKKIQLLPEYEVGCKRVTLSSDYLPCFNEKNVQLVTKPIKEITKNGM